MVIKSQFYLRRFKAEGAVDLYHALKDKRVVRHMASEGITPDVCEDIVKKSNIHWEKYKLGDYAVVCKTTDKIIGWAGFKFWQTNQFELLVVLSPDFWGLGFEVYRELIYRAQHKFKLNEVYVLLPETRRSFRSIEKLGFVLAGNETYCGESFRKFVKKLK